MIRSTLTLSGTILLSFFAGFLSHVLYQRWNPAADVTPGQIENQQITFAADGEPAVHRVSFVPITPMAEFSRATWKKFVLSRVDRRASEDGFFVSAIQLKAIPIS